MMYHYPLWGHVWLSSNSLCSPCSNLMQVQSHMTTGMPVMTKPPWPQPHFFPWVPSSHFRLSTPSELLHFRWNIAKANFLVFHPQPTLSLTFSLLASGIPYYLSNQARNMRTIFEFSISLPSHIQSETKSCQLYSHHPQIYLSSLFPWLLQILHHLLPRLFKVFWLFTGWAFCKEIHPYFSLAYNPLVALSWALAVFLKCISIAVVSGVLDFFIDSQVVHFFSDNPKHKHKHKYRCILQTVKMTQLCHKIPAPACQCP